MKPRPFSLERYFAQYEFSTRYVLCSSDPQSMSIRDLIAMEPGASDALADVWLGYTQSRGDPDLRALIAALYAHGDPERILVHSGANEPIFGFMNAVLSAGDDVVFQSPAYQSHYSVAEAIGASATPWASDLSAGGAPDPNDLAGLIRPSTRAIVITTPNNPTGYTFDSQRLAAVVEIARKHGVWLFSDEVYRGSERDPAARPAAVCDLYERGVSLGAMAKAYGLPGLRIGWIATSDPWLYERMAEFKDYLTICNSAPSEFLTRIALRHSDELLERTRQTCARNLDVLDAFFARRAGEFEWMRPAGGTTAFPRYTRGSTQRLCDELVRAAGVLLLPSVAFDCGDERFRIGYGRNNLPEALAAFDDYLTAKRSS